MEPIVHFRGAVSLLGRFPALAGVDLDVAAGEIVLLQGPNGAGKTTLLRVCAGLGRVTAGVSLACRAAYRRLLERGFRTEIQGVAMHRPDDAGYHRPEALVLDDWR